MIENTVTETNFALSMIFDIELQPSSANIQSNCLYLCFTFYWSVQKSFEMFMFRLVYHNENCELYNLMKNNMVKVFIKFSVLIW